MFKLILVLLFFVFEHHNGVKGHGPPEAVQIIVTRDGPGGTRFLHYKESSLMEDILTADDVKDLPILVFSVTGETRGGKSFLLDLMYKYLDKEGHTSWTEGEIPKVFVFQDGTDSTTKGLWLSTRIFKRTIYDGTKVGIMLMDNQGLFDGEVTSGESVAMSGVSTILSHVQMFNMRAKITTNDLEQIMLHLVPAKSEKIEEPNNQQFIGNSLMFVVRDFIGGRKYGFGLTSGKSYIEYEQKRGTQEHQSMWAEQRKVFSRIECVTLPYPGRNVEEESFTRSPNLKDLESNFTAGVDSFLKEIFSPKNLVTHPGGLTGQKMHDTLKALDGKLADNSLSYYNMFIDRANRIIKESAVKNFTKKLEISGVIHNAVEFMNLTLTTTKFKGLSSDNFTSELRQTLESIINLKVKNHLVSVYKTAITGRDIVSSHQDNWSSITTDMRLFMGPEPVVKSIKEVTVKEIATLYYIKLAEREELKFNLFCENASPYSFYDKMLSLNHSESLNMFTESSIKECEDFERTGVNVLMLNDIRHKQQARFGNNVKQIILKYMFKVKEYFVQRYKNQLKGGSVTATTNIIWPKYITDMNRLEFKTDGEKEEYIHEITKEVAETYYKSLREEVYAKVNEEWSALSNNAFHDIYDSYSEKMLQTIISGRFQEYYHFHNQGLSNIYESEKDTLYKFLLLSIYENLKNRGYTKEAESFWDKHGSTITTGLIAVGLLALRVAVSAG